MTERDNQGKEPSLLRAQLAILAAVPVLLAMSFPHDVKEQVMHDRGCTCERCGRRLAADTVFAHHILPEMMGGASVEQNLFLACSKCHYVVDQLVINQGILANGAHICDVAADSPELIANYPQYEKFSRRFEQKREVFNAADERKHSRKKPLWKR